MPELFAEIITLFYKDMDARIRIDQQLLKEIEINNGLHEGSFCCTLYNYTFYMLINTNY